MVLAETASNIPSATVRITKSEMYCCALALLMLSSIAAYDAGEKRFFPRKKMNFIRSGLKRIRSIPAPSMKSDDEKYRSGSSASPFNALSRRSSVWCEKL